MRLSLEKRNYAIVTMAYWADTLTDGAIRMLVLFYFYQLGYNALQIASLFLLYEVFGIITNFTGGIIATRYGLKSTLFAGLGTQLLALSLLFFMPISALTIPWVMVSQALSGIAKDLTKMSSKSAVKIISGNTEGRLYRWVTLLTGSKNALKGIGFFVGAGLLSLIGFQNAVLTLILFIAFALVLAALWIRGGLGDTKRKAKLTQLYSRNHGVNLLSIARFFLFGARDIWFVVAVPVFLSTVIGWKFWQSGAFMASWVIGYGIVQASAPALLRKSIPTGKTAILLAFSLTILTLFIGLGIFYDLPKTPTLIAGLILFGFLFALNSAVHSFLILDYAEQDKIAMNVGIYYTANSCGRLLGTIFSGYLYQLGLQINGATGLAYCLFASAALLLFTGIISIFLPKKYDSPIQKFE